MKSTSSLAFIILSLAIIYAFVYPSFGEISMLNAERQKYQASLDTIANIEEQKNQLLTEFNRISEENKASIEAVLPDSLDYTKLVSDIAAMAISHGISLDKIAKRELDSSVGNSIEEAGPPKLYRSGTVTLTFEASYQSFGAFLGDLEESLRVLDLRSAKMDVQQNGLYAYNLEFETYWLE